MQEILRRWSELSGNNFPPQSVLARKIGSSSLIGTGSDQGRNRGETLHEIGRAFDRPHTSIRCLLLPRGGIPPAARHRSRIALTLAEREDISRGIASGSSIREIARHLERVASTVSREVKHHGGRTVYRAS